MDASNKESKKKRQSELYEILNIYLGEDLMKEMNP